MPRAYTKSGNIEKYESAEWATPVWSGAATGTITGPNASGNYTVNAPSGYSSKSSGPVCCTTNYGGVEAKYYFVINVKELIVSCVWSISSITFKWDSSNLPSSIRVEVKFMANTLYDSTAVTKVFNGVQGYGYCTKSISGLTSGTHVYCRIISITKEIPSASSWANYSIFADNNLVHIS